MKVLVVEDDAGLAQMLAKSLQANHYQVELAADGESGLSLTRAFDYDLVLLDLNLPKLDGISFCQKLRAAGDDVPVLLMTAENKAESKIAGLDAGADDYVTKPLNTGELLARVRALLRRGRVEAFPLLEWGPLSLDPSACEVLCCDRERLALTHKEYALLELFLRHPHRVFSLDSLIDQLWACDKIPSDNAVRTHIKGLRRKLKQVGIHSMIETVYGLGYRLSQAPFAEQIPDMPSLEVATSEASVSNASVSNSSVSNSSVSNSSVSNSSVSNSSASASALQMTPFALDGLEVVWARHQKKYFELIETIDSVVLALTHNTELLTTGRLTTERLAEACDENADLIRRSQKAIHTLKGALGSFGFIQASKIATKIEQCLVHFPLTSIPQTIKQTNLDSLSRNIQSLQQLPALIQSLRQALNQTLESAPARIPPSKANGKTDVKPSVSNYRWLIIDSDQTWTEALLLQSSIWDIQTQVVSSLEQAQQRLAQPAPDIVLIDPNGLSPLEQDAKTGHELLRQLKEQWPNLPVIVASASDTLRDRIEILRASGDCLFLQKPISAQQIIETMNRLLDQTNLITAAKILVLDDDPLVLESLNRLLSTWGFQLTLLSDPMQIWEILEQPLPDLIILDIEMPTVNGLEICQVIRSDPRLQQVPILFLSAHCEPDIVHRVFEVGGDDYLNKPIIGPELIARVLNRLKRQRYLRQLAEIDSLTGISCRRQSVVLLNQLLRLAARQKRTVCLALLDLDRFKQINDHYGHETGDRVLKTLGDYLRQSFREEDIVARWGGEEFVVGLFDSTQAIAAERLKAFLNRFHQHLFHGALMGDEQAPEQTFQMSFSAGISSYPADGQDLQTLYRSADQALFKAKAAGRNQVVTTDKL